MHDFDTIAYLLAAERDASIKELPEYAEALAQVQADPDLAAQIEEQRAFYAANDDLLANAGMPDAVRSRLQNWIDTELQADTELKTIPFPRGKRNLLSLAAAIGLLIGGTAVVLEMNHQRATQTLIANSSIANYSDFRNFGSQIVAAGIQLQHRDPVMANNIKHLAAAGAPSGENLPPEFLKQKAMGCAVYEVDGVKISLICIDMGGQVVHLFSAPRNRLSSEHPDNTIEVHNDRETRAWQDQEYAYLLVAHNPKQSLGPG